MGVLCDYFRAPDPKVALSVVDRPGGPLAEPRGEFDGVETKWIDPRVVLGS